MNDTPETEAAVIASGGDWSPVLRETCRRLERERDKAREQFSSIHRWIERNHPDGFIDSLTYFQNLDRITENWYDRLDRLEIDTNRFERERDESIELLKEASWYATTTSQENTEKFLRKIGKWEGAK